MDRHARAVNAHPRAELVAAANWRQQSLAAFAERHAIPRTTTDWRELAADPGDRRRRDRDAERPARAAGDRLPEAGKHVLVEKPMAISTAEAEAMSGAAAASPGSLMVAHCWRFHPDVGALRDRVAAGELGEVVKTRGYGVHARWGPSGWFVRRDLAGGGALADMGVHAIDTARFLIGDPQPLRVCGRDRHPLRRVRGGRRRHPADRLVEPCELDRRVGLVAAASAGGIEADTEVYGTGGYARVWAHTEAPDESYEHCPQPMYSAQMAEFVDAVLEGRPPQPDGHHGRRGDVGAGQAYRAAGVAR